MVQINEYIKKWSEKLGITEEEIKKDFDKILLEEEKIHKNMSSEERQTQTLRRLAMAFKKQLRSPAIGFEGILIGASDSFDIVAKQRKEAIALYKENPHKAIEDGLTNEEGVPLDTRQEWSTGNPNRNYGKPLPEHNWIRTIYGIAVKTGTDTEPKLFVMNCNGEVAKNDNIPLFTSVKFRANNRTKEGDSSYILNSSVFTKFEIDESLDLPNPENLLKKYCNDMNVKMEDLMSYHESEKDNYNRLAIIEGDVSTLILEPTSVGSRRIVIEDETKMLEDLESQGITCWIPQRIKIDFGEQSKILVLGRTSQGKKLDENGNQTDEPGDIMINVFGLYAIPKYKIEPNIKEITEENIETTETTETTETPESKETSERGGW